VTIQEFGDKLKSYLGQQLLEKDRIQWEFHENIHSNGLLSSGEVMHLFRIVQEIISNSIKHSGANQISIELESETDQNYQLTITDNGKGFKYTQQNDNHYGIENIQNRAREIEADLKIWSEPGKGTWIRIRKEKNNTYRLFKEKNADSTFMV
jgi:signal transduction histidine kinase